MKYEFVAKLFLDTNGNAALTSWATQELKRCMDLKGAYMYDGCAFHEDMLITKVLASTSMQPFVFLALSFLRF